MNRIVPFLFLILILGCRPHSGDTSTDFNVSQIDPIVPDQLVQQWGYATIENKIGAQSEWELREFGPAEKRYQNIKALNQVPGWEDAYYRFTITEEVYATPREATHRLEHLSHSPPGVNTKQNPHLVLRKGIRFDNKVITVSTDVLKFEMEELPRVMDLVSNYLSQNDDA